MAIASHASKLFSSRKCVAGDGGGREDDGKGRGCEDSSSSRGLCTSIEDGAVSSDPISDTPSLFLANCSLHCIYSPTAFLSAYVPLKVSLRLN